MKLLPIFPQAGCCGPFALLPVFQKTPPVSFKTREESLISPRPGFPLTLRKQVVAHSGPTGSLEPELSAPTGSGPFRAEVSICVTAPSRIYFHMPNQARPLPPARLGLPWGPLLHTDQAPFSCGLQPVSSPALLHQREGGLGKGHPKNEGHRHCLAGPLWLNHQSGFVIRFRCHLLPPKIERQG